MYALQTYAETAHKGTRACAQRDWATCCAAFFHVLFGLRLFRKLGRATAGRKHDISHARSQPHIWRPDCPCRCRSRMDTTCPTRTLGPRVTLTASAKRSTPCSSKARASLPNLISLLAMPRMGVALSGTRRAAGAALANAVCALLRAAFSMLVKTRCPANLLDAFVHVGPHELPNFFLSAWKALGRQAHRSSRGVGAGRRIARPWCAQRSTSL